MKEATMRASVIYESLYGNTAAIAAAIANRLTQRGLDVRLLPINDADSRRINDVDLLVVGAPTHMHGMSRAATRSGAAKDPKNVYERPTVTPGIRTWLQELPDGDHRACAAFDTRLRGSIGLTGSAARGIERQMRLRSFQPAVRSGSFLVTKDNLLAAGEEERARVWADTVVDTLASAAF